MEYLEAKDIIKELINDEFSIRITEALSISLKLIDKEIKKEENKPPKRKPCICGIKRPRLWFYTNSPYMFYECPRCGRKSGCVKHRNKLNKAWNDMIEEEMRRGVQEK